ncbi:peptide chain release factor 3 [Aureliella helgolandensis]|uniref:Peptide chain release factor 3 n=1 Tax=Aureliella helgolandensis TaxID=2527968 RepID=A0A518G1F2_9BACT|nr:peptide chain release factor 3 [Aureliella helgolandensis]QDV22428.1 Peptide chain release factor 3 [Aureliella helgolandensis]
MNRTVDQQRNRRRTFAIISHPDAGKTTLTEKLLLFGGSIEIAGAVRGRKSQRAATSDWMELEKQRGISVSSTVLTFEFDDCLVNLLDTPGHHDFSEDTYRTLMAADAAVMVVDQAKGVEAQTEKLFRVCAMRGIPVMTFVNKVDRPGLAPLEVIDEIETKFGIEVVPQNWPVGGGQDFRGIVDLQQDMVHLYDEISSSRRVASRQVPFSDFTPENSEDLNVAAGVVTSTRDDVDLIRSAGTHFDQEQFMAGKQSPIFFGSALTNIGVERFLRGFLKLCPVPRDRTSNIGEISASREGFAGFVFKIQANLDPRHRDRVAFVRVCAGRFERDMEATVARSGKKLRLPRALRIFGQERETMDEAYPGDIIGLVNPGEFLLGDTIFQGEPFHYEALPQFSPEFFAVLNCTDTSRRKQFDRGLSQLVEEGAIQIFHDPRSTVRELILAAVGELQFDVVRFRLESEYNTQTSLSWRSFKLTRWIEGLNDEVTTLKLPYGAKRVRDQFGHDAVLLQTEWDANFVERENPKLRFTSMRMLGASEH